MYASKLGLNNRNQGRFAPLIVGLLAVLTPMASQAADPAACNNYAATAVQQHRDNQALGCGFNDLRWTDNAPAAYIYCMTFGEGTAGADTTTRDQLLNQCRAQKAAEAAANGNGPTLQMDLVAPVGVLHDGNGGVVGNGPTLQLDLVAPVGVLHDGNGGVVGNGPTLQMDLVAPVGTLHDGSGTAQPEVKDTESVTAIIPAGSPSPGNNCQPSIRAGSWGDTRLKAMEGAQIGWGGQARTAHGSNFSSFNGAREASFECTRRPRGHYCVAIGRPCNNVRGIDPDPQPDAVAANDLVVVEQGQSAGPKLCQHERHEVRRYYDGDKRDIFYKWVRANWEFEVAQKYGYEFARLESAIMPYLGCTAPVSIARLAYDWACVAHGTPCIDPAYVAPKCYPSYRLSLDQDIDPLSYDAMWVRWGLNINTFYGPDYRNELNAIDVTSGQYTAPAWDSNFGKIIRFVEARACRQ